MFARMGDAEFKTAAAQVAQNAKSALANIDVLPNSSTVRYDWDLPHVLTYSNKVTQNQRAIQNGQ